MDGTSLSSSHSSSSEQEPQSDDNSTLQGAQEHSDVQHTVTRDADENSQGDRLLSEEEQVTLITESMSITSADEEKLLLLNRNTELRRLNKELMKLNEDWDHIYRSTTVSLEQRLVATEEESTTLKQINHRLLLKVEHEQSKREYYEQTLLQELKKNQHLQEYVRLLEARLHHTSTDRDWPVGALNGLEVARPPEVAVVSEPPRGQCQGAICCPPLLGMPPAVSTRKSRTQTNRSEPCRASDVDGVTVKEVQEMKEQLEALRCQTRIYEADYKTEHKDRQRMVLENKKLRRKEGEMRQQMALLQEQLKVYEDDFRKERSDKQVLQRLLMKKAPHNDPILIHRCNNDHDRPAGGEGELQKEREKGGDKARPPSGKHCDRLVRKTECPHHPYVQRHADYS
ncbi:hypothetical protein COCON_G00045890 [Conger conger]|uniref:Uncharacterized protein n=1 Tax=Conger conger TaxID=82655 RepID=A0A9Q1DUK7_CONCO|nr:TNFAIP3-interacting protein 1 [Conger conger]KAJ8282070.1 hypothetical protein COCON_G00045890 [Conger conger]